MTEIVTNIFVRLLVILELKFESRSLLQHFIRIASINSYDLSDLLIACSAKEKGCRNVLTFDRKASKSDLFELLK